MEKESFLFDKPVKIHSKLIPFDGKNLEKLMKKSAEIESHIEKKWTNKYTKYVQGIFIK